MQIRPNNCRVFDAKITILKTDMAQSLGYNTNIVENIGIKKYL